MPALEWHKVGDRRYETGVDRGIFQLPGGNPIVWNGLTAVDDSTVSSSKSYYQDGVKIFEHQLPGEYEGTIKAFTYPDEFEQCLGMVSKGHGLFAHDQRPKPFNLAYRTKIGNDLDGPDHGYKIHFLYNLMAIPDGISFGTQSGTVDAQDFSWKLSAVPAVLEGLKPTAHLSLNSTQVDPAVLEALEVLLYGTEDFNPYFPAPQELLDIVNGENLTVIDGGNGIWSVFGPDNLISAVDGQFQITGINSTTVDANTYSISTTDT